MKQRQRICRLPIAMAVAAALALASPLYAQSKADAAGGSTEEAKARFDRGVELFSEGNYRAALVEFRRAYELAPNYRVLYNLGKVHYQLQEYAKAMGYLERYLDEGGRQVPDKRRKEVEREIARLKDRVAKVMVEANLEEAEITIDEEVVGKTPLREPIPVSAGRHKIAATAKGRKPASKTIEVAGGDQTTVSLVLDLDIVAPPPTAPERPPPPPPAQSHSIPTGIWIAWAAAGVLAGAAVVTGVVALGAASDRDDQKAAFPVTRAELADADSKATAFGIVTDVLIGSAVLTGGIALVLTISASGSSKSTGLSPGGAPRIAAPTTVRLAPTGRGILATGTF